MQSSRRRADGVEDGRERAVKFWFPHRCWRRARWRRCTSSANSCTAAQSCCRTRCRPCPTGLTTPRSRPRSAPRAPPGRRSSGGQARRDRARRGRRAPAGGGSLCSRPPRLPLGRGARRQVPPFHAPPRGRPGHRGGGRRPARRGPRADRCMGARGPRPASGRGLALSGAPILRGVGERPKQRRVTGR